MRDRIIALAGATVLAAFMTSASWAADNSAFLKDAIQGSMAEVKLGELAQKNGGSADVKQFGSTLVNDHTDAMNKASELAKSMDVPVPTEPTAEAQQEYEKLQGMTGAEFDKEFAEHMVQGHEKTIQEFEQQAGDGSGQVAEYAKATLPTLKQHLETAQNIEAQQK
jgi:putative membrane protein